MTQEEKVLVDKYVEYKKEADAKQMAADEVLRKLSKLAPHQYGDIISWTEQKEKNIGTMWHPKFVELPSVKKRAVLVNVNARVSFYRDDENRLGYRYDFKPIKKDGSLGQNFTYPNNYEWTGEKYDKEF